MKLGFDEFSIPLTCNFISEWLLIDLWRSSCNFWGLFRFPFYEFGGNLLVSGVFVIWVWGNFVFSGRNCCWSLVGIVIIVNPVSGSLRIEVDFTNLLSFLVSLTFAPYNEFAWIGVYPLVWQFFPFWCWNILSWTIGILLNKALPSLLTQFLIIIIIFFFFLLISISFIFLFEISSALSEFLAVSFATLWLGFVFAFLELKL